MKKSVTEDYKGEFPVQIDPAAPLAVSTQIAEQIKFLIAVEELMIGEALPPTNTLAKQLNANHNTIANVYSSLVDSGYLIAQRGKGTFVADTLCVQNLIRNSWHYTLLRQAFTAAQNIQLSPAEFAGAAYAQAIILANSQQDSPKLVFVEEESPYGLEICKLIELEIGLPVSFIGYASVVAKQPESLEKLFAADLVITTTDYANQATQISELHKEILALQIRPNFNLLTQISSLSRRTRMLVIGYNQSEAKRLKQLLEKSGISHIELYTSSLEDVLLNINELANFDTVCISLQVQAKNTSQALLNHSDLNVFSFKVDPTNLLVLKARITSIPT